ncbi:hypothetical protein NXS19_012537 [Fusarium pseudograminearum]|nr:hypothetical protein NXS19_012537 [Fusarium pseudograminearum]
MGSTALNSTQRNDAFYFEVLEMSLTELDTKKSIKVTLLSEGITKEDTYDLLVPKTGTMDDLVEALIKKAQISGEAESGRIRIYETSSNRFYREPPRDHPVINLNEYATVYAERVPQEEVSADDNQFVQVFHYQTMSAVFTACPSSSWSLRARTLQTPRRDWKSELESKARASKRLRLLSCDDLITRSRNILMMTMCCQLWCKGRMITSVLIT